MKKEFGASKELKKRFAMAIPLFLGLGLLFTVSGSFRISRLDISTGVLSVFIGILQFLLAWLTTDITRSTRLVLTPENLEFYSPGLVLTTSWDNLKRIGSMSTIVGIKYDSLVLRAAATQKTAWWFKLMRNRPEHEIPLSMFSNWRRSELGQEIKKYAPHLFSDHGAGK